MSLHEKTLTIVTNLDRAAIESKLGELRSAAQAEGHVDLARALTGLEGMPRGEMERRLRESLRWLSGRPELKSFADHLELIELNLPNLT